MNFRCFNYHHCHGDRYCHCCRDAREHISLVWLFLVISSGFSAFGAQDSVMPHLPLEHFLLASQLFLNFVIQFSSIKSPLFETPECFYVFFLLTGSRFSNLAKKFGTEIQTRVWSDHCFLKDILCFPGCRGSLPRFGGRSK